MSLDPRLVVSLRDHRQAGMPHLVLAYCHGALLVTEAGIEILNRAQRRAKGGRRPLN